MLYEKMNLMKKPFTKKFSFRNKNWYLFPQRWVWKQSVAEIKFLGNGVYEHTHFWLVHKYQFSWLFIDVIWELKHNKPISITEVIHEPVRYVSGKGEISNSHSY